MTAESPDQLSVELGEPAGPLASMMRAIFRALPSQYVLRSNRVMSAVVPAAFERIGQTWYAAKEFDELGRRLSEEALTNVVLSDACRRRRGVDRSSRG